MQFTIIQSALHGCIFIIIVKCGKLQRNIQSTKMGLAHLFSANFVEPHFRLLTEKYCLIFKLIRSILGSLPADLYIKQF